MDHAVQRLRDPALAALNGVPFHLATWIARSMSGDMGSVGNKEVFRHADFIFMIVKLVFRTLYRGFCLLRTEYGFCGLPAPRSGLRDGCNGHGFAPIGSEPW